MAQGIGGFMDLTGQADGEPTRAGVPISDIFTGVYSVVGILAALTQRERTGRGCHIDTALVDSTVAVLANQALNYLVSSEVPKRIGNAHPNIVPYQVFPAADGHLIVATGNDRQFQKFCAVLGEDKLAADPAYASNKDRLARRVELIDRLSAATARMKRDELLNKLEAVQVPAGPINTLADVFTDPQVKHRGMLLELPSEAAPGGKIPGVRSPITIDGQAMASPRPSPRLGEHTEEILREIGES
jgi:crotonobetainyl-CoA:carnitine CoA-transferase CaiB-like acyl-CoA transferase